MRKPALDEPLGAGGQAAAVADSTPHVNQTHATQVRNDAATAGVLAGVVAGDISAEAAANGDTKVGELTAASQQLGGAAVATGTSTIVNASQPSSSLQQLDQRDERVKKSVAYQHTVFHRFALDKLGKQYEKRMCSYCSAAFSFKGGTTSAALRHLKTSHADRLLYPGVNMGMAQQLQQQIQLQLQLQDLQQKQIKAQHHQAAQQQQQQLQQTHQSYGDSKSNETSADVEQDAEITEDQQHSPEDQAAGSVPASLLSSHDAERGFNGDASGKAGATEYVDHPTVALDETIDGVAMVEEEENGGEPADEGESEVLPDEKHLLPKARQAVKRKRQRQQCDDTDSSDANDGSGGDTNNAVTPNKFPSPLTVSQQAITHFLLHYKEMLSVPNRLRFVKHLTHHPSEAEMYNVLDAATQMEYVREFSDHATTTI